MSRNKIWGKMTMQELMNRVGGVQTIDSLKSALKISRQKAVYLIYRLRKKGYVQTKQKSNNVRVYYISPENAFGGTSYIEILNRYSPVKISSSEIYKIYGRKVSIEETIVYSIKTRKLRYILSSIALFKKIRNWPELHRLANKNNLTREIGALYELTEIILAKVKKMPRRYLRHWMPKKNEKFKYIIHGLNSKDFSEIEKKWKIYLPFNKEDLAEYMQ